MLFDLNGWHASICRENALKGTNILHFNAGRKPLPLGIGVTKQPGMVINSLTKIV